MARASIYLNFPGNTEEAFVFNQSVFGGNFGNDGIARFEDMPGLGI
jgi:PhnB protein